jgi:AcrR family transcriptional regulator
MPRHYKLGRRQPSVDATARSIVAAAGELVREGGRLSLAAVARKAGVARITVYNRFGSREGLLRALAPRPPQPPAEVQASREALRRHLELACERWAADPALFRNLGRDEPPEEARRLAEQLAAEDALRPGCSIREAEDVIAALGSFAVFDRLHRDGRRSAPAVADVLMRLTSGIVV